MQNKWKKSLIVAAALIVGFLMPYLSRIPLAFTYGAAWIWKHIDNSNDFSNWNGFHLGSLIPIVIFGLLYIFGKVKWAFYAAAFGQFAATYVLYYDFMECYENHGFLEYIILPTMIVTASFLCGITVLAAEYFINRRKNKSQIEKENQNAFV